MLTHPGLRPFMVAAEAFGPGVPARDLHFSRQHRLLVTGNAIARRFGTDQALAHVHALASGDRVYQALPPLGADYHHLLFDRHEIVLSEGLATETLLLTQSSGQICDLLRPRRARTPPGLRRLPIWHRPGRFCTTATPAA